MSATLGALVIAIATEFSVLLAARYDEERAPGVSVGEALRRAYSRTGVAVLASGVTAIAGFAAPDRDRHPDAARLRARHRARPRRRAARRAARPPGGARLGGGRVRPPRLADAGAGRRATRLPTRDERSSRKARPRARRRPSSRYSIFVGLAFVVLIVVATINTLRRPRRRASSAPADGSRRRRCRSSRSRTLRGAVGGRRQRLPGRLRHAANPCPADDQRTPACEVDVARRRDPRLRPLRQAARDLVLVHARRRLPADPGRRRRRGSGVPRAG